MSFDALSPDPNPPKDSLFLDSVTAKGSRRLARRRGVIAGLAIVAVVAAAVPLALRASDEAEVRTDRGSASQPTLNADTTTTTAPLPQPIVVYGTGPTGDCAATVLVPSDLPVGFEPIRDPQPKAVDWQTAWGNGDARVYVYGDFSGDWGDDPNLRGVTVRGHPAALGRTSPHVEGAPDEFAVTWRETSPCAAEYAVFSEGLDEDTALRVAESLRDTPKPDLAAQTEDARRTYVGRSYTHDTSNAREPKLKFAPPESGSVWLIESGFGSSKAGDPGEALHEVHDGTRRMIFYGEIQEFGSLEEAPTMMWDVLVIDFDAQYACGQQGDQGYIFGRLAPGSGRYRQLERAWRGDPVLRRIVEVDPAGIRCDTQGETGNYSGPYSDS